MPGACTRRGEKQVSRVDLAAVMALAEQRAADLDSTLRALRFAANSVEANVPPHAPTAEDLSGAAAALQASAKVAARAAAQLFTVAALFETLAIVSRHVAEEVTGP